MTTMSVPKNMAASAWMIVAVSLMACESSPDQDSEIPGSLTPVACGDLAFMNLENGTVVAAVHDPSGRFHIENPGPFMPPVIEDLPAVCRVTLMLSPVAASRIGVEVWLPATGWNGRLLMIGNGGYSSTIGYAALADGLRGGYAMIATDTGHQGDDPDFARDHPERIVDWAWRAVHEAVNRGSSVIAEAYGRLPTYRYFAGCSTGGHQALMSAQRFPEDFDGIIAGAPGHNRTHLNAAFLWQFLQNHDSQAPHKTILPPGKLALLNEAVLEQCRPENGGPAGGLADDPWLNDPLSCNFDPARLACKDDAGGDCLEHDEIDAARAIYAGPLNPRTGERIYFGQLPGSETAGGPPALPGWSLYWANPMTPGTPARASFWKYWALNDEDWDWWTFDFDADMRATDDRLAATINAMNPDLHAFAAKGGKLLHFHGLSDAVVPATDSISYFERVSDLHGEDTSGFYRLYLAPGVHHCTGGPGPDRFDMLAALVDWVERGIAPDRIIAAHMSDQGDGATVSFERPLCPYPKRALFSGGGNPERASSFHCALPPRLPPIPELGSAYRR